jgi:hypothetical protein
VACINNKPMTSVNDNARIINKLDALLTEDGRVVIYDHHMFIVQATVSKKPITAVIYSYYNKLECLSLNTRLGWKACQGQTL